MKRFLLMLLMAAMAMGAPTAWAMADDVPQTAQKPVAVVSLAGYDAMMGNFKYITKVAGNPQIADGVEGFIKLVTKNQGLAGLDKSRPWGVVVNSEGENLTGYGFFPVNDLAKLGDALEGIIGQPQDMGDGVYRIEGKNGKPPMFVKEGKGWAFFADQQAKLVNLPDDPSTLLGGLEKQYKAAVRLNLGSVPETLRQKIVEDMESSAKRDAGKRWHESDGDHALRLKITAEVVKYLKTTIDQLQEVTLGWNLEPEAGKCYLDASFVGKPGTELAKSAESLRNSHSRFAGFVLSDAAITGNLNGQLPAFKADLLEEIFANIHQKAVADMEKKEHDPAKIEVGKKFLEKLFPLIRDTIATGRVDKGFSAILKPDAVTVVVGGAVANEGRIEEMLKLALETAKKDHPQKAVEIDSWVKLGAEKLGDITLNTISIPIPPDAKDREKVVSLIGDTLQVVIGSSKDSMYVAAGREPMAALKKAIEQSAAEASKTVPPLEISVSLSKVAEFIAVVGKPHERPRAAKLAQAFQQSPSEDRVVLRAQPLENGVQYRLEVQPGVLKAFEQMHK